MITFGTTIDVVKLEVLWAKKSLIQSEIATVKYIPTAATLTALITERTSGGIKVASEG